MDADKKASRSKVKSVTAKVDPAKVPPKKKAKPPSPAPSSKPPSRPPSSRPPSSRPASSRPASSRPKSGSRPPSSRPKSGSRPPSSKAEEEEKKPPTPEPAPKRPLPEKDEVVIAELTHDALRGKTDREYPLTIKIVRIFTSSTFTDTKVERNTLMERVYPKLRLYCQKQGYEFQVVDMRWGVRDEATDDHMTSELCMREIKDCQTYSTGPSFITFLAQKYGYRPFPPKIQAVEFEKLLKAVRKADSKKLLTDWFVKDENCVPAQYQLQPIREKLQHYANDEQPEKKKQARSKWWEVFEKIQLTLRDAASQNLEEEKDAHKYFWSVTEEEIQNGILDYDNAKKGCFWFRRDLTDLQDNVKSKMAPRFMDITGDVDKEALDLLTKLKEEMLPEKLPEENVIKYEVKWTENGIDVEESEEHREYIDKFSEDFERVLKDMIEEGIHERYKTEVDDLLYQESVQHVMFGQNKAKLFCGRQEFLDRVKEMVTEGNDGKPIVICGEAGSGKTTFMAKVFQMIPEWLEHGDEVPVVVRFVGTTVQSATTRDLLFSLCQQIHKLTENEAEIPDDIKKLREYFQELVQDLSDPLCIVIDSLDQLKDAGKGLREWVPTSLPDGVRLIMSSIPGEEFHVVPELQKFLPEESFVDIPALTKDDVETIVQAMFEKSERTLQAVQMEQLISACETCPLPLYTKIAFDEACRWKSHQKVDSNALGATVTVLINSLFDKVEKYHGTVLVSHALGYITASRAGLSLGEIEDVLSIDDVALNDIYQYHMPPLRRLPPLLWVRIQADLKDYLVSTGAGGVQVIRWYHRQFNTVATERYLADDEARMARHSILAEFFIGQWSNGEKKLYTDKKGKQSEADRHVAAQPLIFKEASNEEEKTQFNLRKMNELCYHLVKSKQIDLAKEHCLCNFEWIYEKMEALGIFAVLEDYEFVHEAEIKDQESSAVEDILELAKNGVALDHKRLPCHLLGRLYNLPDWEEKPYIKQLVAKANKPHFDCLIPTLGFLETSGGPYLRKFVGHETQVLAYGVNEDGSKLVSCGMGEKIIVWDLETAEILKTFPNPEEARLSYNLSTMIFCNEDKCAALMDSTNLLLLDLETGEAIHNIDMSVEDETLRKGCCYVNQTRNIMYGCTSTTLVAHDLKSGKEVFKIKKKSPAVEDTFGHRTPFVGGQGSNVAYHFPGDNNVHFINDVDYAKKKKVVTKELFSTKDLKPEHSIVRMTTTSEGVLACYVLEPPRTTEPGFKFADAFADIRTFDIKTGEELQTFKKLQAGMTFGLDALMATSPKNVVFPAYMGGNFYFKEYDLETGDARDTLIEETSMFMCLGSALKDRILFTSLGDQMNIQLVDLSKCRKTTDTSLTDTIKKPKTFGLNLHGPLLDSKRYLDYHTLSVGLGVWDLAKNMCIRHGNAYDNGPTAKWVSPTSVVMARQGHLFNYYDYKEDKFLGTIEKMMAENVEEQCKPFVAVPGEEKIMLVGPKPNEISTYDLKKGAIESTMKGPKNKMYGGLLASANFEILIVMDSYNKEVDGTDKKKDYTLSVYDLKKKKELGGIKYKASTPIVPNTLDSTYVVSLSKDGKYFATVLDYVPHVWNTHLGKPKKYEDEESKADMAGIVRLVEPTGEVIVGYTPGKLRKFDMKSQKCTLTFDTKEDDVRYIEISEDGQLAACRPNGWSTLSLIDINRGQILMTFSVGKHIYSSKFSTNGQFLLLTVQGVDAVLPLFIYHKDKHQDDPEDPTPESKAREELLDDPDLFGEPLFLEAKPPEQGAKKKKEDEQEKKKDKKKDKKKK